MDLQPTLENDLVVLRPLRENDFETLYQVAKDHLIWEQHPSNDRFMREVYSEFFEDSIQSKVALIIIDKQSNSIIGNSRFKSVNNAANAVEIGWSFLSRNFWGGKYNKSIKKLLIDNAFKFVDDVVFYIGKNNIRSQKAVTKIGAKRITDSNFKHLIKASETDWTFLINKKDWFGT